MRDDSEHPELFPYQREGAQWLSRQRRALLADDPGLGKSAQAITACDRIQAERILVLCPAIARLNWIREFEKFSTRGRGFTAVLDGRRGAPATAGVVCSYDLSHRPSVATWLASRQWDVVIADESHYLNGTTAQRTKAVLGKGGLIHRTRHFWALSGTPARNHAGELWGLLYVCGVTRLSQTAFIDYFCQTRETPYGTQVVGNRHVDEYRRMLQPFMLRRNKEDVLKDLPPILLTDVAVEAAPVDMMRWYHEVLMGWKKPAEIEHAIREELFGLQKTMELVGIGEPAADALKGLGEKAELSRRYVGLSKVPPIVSLLREELTTNAYPKIVLFGWHRDVLMFLREQLVEFRAMLLFGGTPAIKREAIIRKFQRDPRCRVLVCNVQAAGTAITLTAAYEVGIVEASYVPSDMAQAVMRVHRIGQDHPVRVRFFNLADSVDEQIQRIIRRKTRDLVSAFDTPASPDIINPFQ